MAEGTPALTRNDSQWRGFDQDSGYSTATPNSSSVSSLSPELVSALRSSPRKRPCISSSTPEENNSCPLTKRKNFKETFRTPFLSLSDLEDSLCDPHETKDEGYLDVFDDMEVDGVDHQEMLQEKKSSERKTFLLADSEIDRICHKRHQSIYVGKEKVDFLRLLGDANNYSLVLKNIFKNLAVEDLLNVSLVCKSWWNICKTDRNVRTQVTKYLQMINGNKENLEMKQPKALKPSASLPSTPRRHFFELQNLNRETSRRPKSASSPPVSPTSFRFHQFFKVAQTIPDGKSLAPCPRCSLPSLIDSKQNVGQCTREGCRYTFCCLCHCDSHGTQSCRVLMLAPRNKKRIGSIGSKNSKKNLRRLC